MSDHAEEQSLEAEALEAIFDSHFTKLVDDVEKSSSTDPAVPSLQRWRIELYPELDQEECHVACQLEVTLPETYPEVAPEVSVQIIQGLTKDHARELTDMAIEEAEANLGVPSIYSISEKLREWLMDNNRPGLDDLSMHAQMLRKQEQSEKKEMAKFESQIEEETMTEAEREELLVQQRRAEGTPCNKENFLAWKEKFEKEMAAEDEGNEEKKERSGMTGYDYFRNKVTNLEALEKEAEEAAGEADEDEEDVDEALFEEDIDLDELDFDEDDEDLDI